MRFLIPLKNIPEATPALAFVAGCRQWGRVSAVLLHVASPIRCCQPDGLEREIPESLLGKAEGLFLRALCRLEGLGIETTCHLALGPVVFTILDVAEALDCHAIVVPEPRKLYPTLLSRNIVGALKKEQRTVPIITVNRQGIAAMSFDRSLLAPSI